MIKILILIGALVSMFFVFLLVSMVQSRKGKHHVIYQVEGNRNAKARTSFGSENTWVYVTANGTSRSTIRLPWKLHYYAPARTTVALSAQYQDDSPNGWLEAKIYVDGQLIQSARSSGNGTATVSGTVP